MPEQKRKFKVADFVSKIVKDPNAPPNTLLLQGYLGDSSDEGHVRLYLDPQLSDYVEIPENAILHTQEIPNATLGETYVWIEQDAELTHGKAGPQRLKASFLEGRIQQAFLGGATATAAAAPGIAQTGPAVGLPFSSWGPVCQSRLIIQCHTHAPMLCPVSVPVYQCHPSVATPCVPQTLTCQSVLTPCISHNVICPTQNPVQCPPASGGVGCGPVGPGPEQFTAAAAVPPPTISPQLCPSAIDACPSRLAPCPTGDFVPCPSVPVFQCPSRIIVQCPSAVDACPSRLCPSVPVLQCPSRIIVQCPSAQPQTCPTGDFAPCPSVPVFQCPSRIIAQCPSAYDACPSRPCQSVPVIQCFPSRITTCQSADPRTCVVDSGF